MKLKLFSIYDTVAEIFNRPFADINDASAIRSFDQLMIEQGKNKTDYILYNIGEYSDQDGMIQPNVPKKIRTGFDVSDEIEKPDILREQAV